MEFNELKEKIKMFNLERDWDKFHNPKDLLIALVSEVGELAECYRWLNDTELSKIHTDPIKKKKIEEEIADITMYLIMLATAPSLTTLPSKDYPKVVITNPWETGRLIDKSINGIADNHPQWVVNKDIGQKTISLIVEHATKDIVNILG